MPKCTTAQGVIGLAVIAAVQVVDTSAALDRGDTGHQAT